jgi:hypothetical protein
MLIVMVAAVVLPAVAFGGRPGGLCPAGTNERPNSGFSFFADVGCSLCLSGESCEAVGCLTVPVMLCPPGPSVENLECCQGNPCNGNCPEPDDPLLCSFETCTCEPEGCCTVACPVQTMAPVAGSNGLIVLTVLLAATGVLYLGRRIRRTS